MPPGDRRGSVREGRGFTKGLEEVGSKSGATNSGRYFIRTNMLWLLLPVSLIVDVVAVGAGSVEVFYVSVACPYTNFTGFSPPHTAGDGLLALVVAAFRRFLTWQMAVVGNAVLGQLSPICNKTINPWMVTLGLQDSRSGA